MASIIEDTKRGRLLVYYYASDGKRHGKQFSLNERRAAKRFAAEQDTKKKDVLSGVDLQTAVVFYIEDRSVMCALGTWTRYKSALEDFAEHVGPTTPLGRIGVHQIAEWRNKRLESKQKSTVRNDLKCMRAFFTWCVNRKWCETNPAKSVDIPRVKRGIPSFLTPEQIEKLLSSLKKDAPKEYYLIGVMALRCGLRRNEILTMPWSAINFEQRILTISGKSIEDRIVPMHNEVYTALSAWPKTGDFVFAKKYKVQNNVRSPDVAKRFNQWLRDHKWPVTLHGLRHSFAVSAVTRGASERAVGDLLGHQDVRTTRIYARSYLDHLRIVVEGAGESRVRTVVPSARTEPKEKRAKP